jgi:hypothetical protein
MAEVVTQEQYDQIKEYYKEQKGYEDMSDEEKERIDKYLDKALNEMFEVDESDDASESAETAEIGEKKMELSRTEVENKKAEIRDIYGYEDMPEEQKEAFDEYWDNRFDETFDIDEDGKEQEKVEEGEKVKKLIR